MLGFSFLHSVALVVTLLAPQRVGASATSAILWPNCYTPTIPNPGVCAFRGGGEDSSSSSGSRHATPSPLRSSTWSGGVGHKMGGGGYGRRRIPGVGVPKGVLEKGLHGIHYVVSKTSRLALVFPLLVASDAVRVPVDALPAAACTLAGASVPLNTMKLLFGRGSFLGKWTYIVTHKLLLPARLVWLGLTKAATPLLWVVMRVIEFVNTHLVWRAVKAVPSVSSGGIKGALRLTAVCGVAVRRGFKMGQEGGAAARSAGGHAVALAVGGVHRCITTPAEYLLGKPIRGLVWALAKCQQTVFPAKTGARPLNFRGHARTKTVPPPKQADSKADWGRLVPPSEQQAGSGGDDVAGGIITQRWEVETQTQTKEGERLAIIGSHPVLGSWDVDRALGLMPAFNIQEKKRVWSLSARLPAGEKIEYKYVLINGGGAPVWEGCFENRQLIVGSPKVRLDVVEGFPATDPENGCA